MSKVRGFIFNLLYTTSVVICSIPAALVAPLLNYQNRVRFLGLWPRLVQSLLALTCGITFRIEGRENLPKSPYVLISNHQSTWETLTLFYIFSPISAVLKKELTYIPLFGWLIHLTRPIVIDRKRRQNALKEILRQGQSLLKDGVSVVIFPEGTRVPVEEDRNHFPGGAMLACKAGVPVVPIVHNAGRFWPAHKLDKYPGEITIRIGSAIHTEGRSPKELNQQVESWINTQKKSL